jgi:hypothetical protein
VAWWIAPVGDAAGTELPDLVGHADGVFGGFTPATSGFRAPDGRPDIAVVLMDGTAGITPGSVAVADNWTAQAFGGRFKLDPGQAEFTRLAEKGSNTEWALVRSNLVRSDRVGVQCGGTTIYNTSSFEVFDGAWHHVFATIAADYTVKLCLDGVLDGTASGTATAIKAGDVFLGRWAGGDLHLAGELGDFRIDDRVLSDPEVAALAAAGYPDALNRAARPRSARQYRPHPHRRRVLIANFTLPTKATTPVPTGSTRGGGRI